MARGRRWTRLTGVGRTELVPPPARGSFVVTCLHVTNCDAAAVTLTVVGRQGTQDFPIEDAVILETKDKLTWTGEIVLLPGDSIQAYLAAKPTTQPVCLAAWSVDT